MSNTTAACVCIIGFIAAGAAPEAPPGNTACGSGPVRSDAAHIRL